MAWRVERAAAILAPILFCLVACTSAKQPPQVVSLEEARQLTARLRDTGFTAPPRTIDDITAILDREKPNPAKFAAQQAKADARPPAGVAGAELALFYEHRGFAAYNIGRAQQVLADNRKAAEILEPIRGQNAGLYINAILWLANAENRSGHPREFQELYRDKLIPFVKVTPNFRWRLFGVYSNFIYGCIQLGQMKQAEQTLAELDEVWNDWKSNSRNNMRFYLNYEGFVNLAHAYVLDAQGKYAEAEPHYRPIIESEDQIIGNSSLWGDADTSAQFQGTQNWALYNLSRNLANQGRLVEAEVEMRRALVSELKLSGRYSDAAGRDVNGLADILSREGRFKEAETLDRAALDIYKRIGQGADSTAIAFVRAALAWSLAAQHRWREAGEEYMRIRQGLGAKDPALFHRIIDSSPALIVAAAKNGGGAEVADVARTLYQDRLKSRGEQSLETAQARSLYAVTLAATGHPAQALAEFRAAMPNLVDAAAQRGNDDELGTSSTKAFNHVLMESYLGILASQGTGANTAAEAFSIADAARSSTVQRALLASLSRSAVHDPNLADLARREQDAGQQEEALNALLSSQIALPSDQQDSADITTLRTQSMSLRAARMTLRAEIERRFPDYVNLLTPRPATIADVQSTLHAGEALIATYVADDATYVWAVPKSGAAAFAVVPLSRAKLREIVVQLRRALDPHAAKLSTIPPFDAGLAYRLYQALLVPVSSGWQGANSLMVVAHGPLGALPFALLVTAPVNVAPENEGQALFANYKSVPWLIRKVAVTNLPSVTALTALRRATPPNSKRRAFVGFGDPWFNPAEAAEARAEIAAHETKLAYNTTVKVRGIAIGLRAMPATESVDSAELADLPRLPETAEEVREVAAALGANPTRDVILGDRANEQAVLKMKLDDRRVVMFATHGLLPGDVNGLTEPALAMSSPKVANVAGDGLLTMHEILGLKLDADWVVLSACNTARGNGAGAEAVSGLGLAFFYAGTRAVLASNWPVETISAEKLITGLFKREVTEPGITRAQALRQTMLALIDGDGLLDPKTGKVIYSYAHPLFWAPFSLYGDGDATSASSDGKSTTERPNPPRS